MRQRTGETESDDSNQLITDLARRLRVEQVVPAGAELTIRTLLRIYGEDPDREGLLATPTRVAKMYSELFSGYSVDVGSLLRQFEHDAEDGGMVIVKDVPVTSLCEHHLLPFFGTASVGYLPCNDRVVGLSKLSRLVDAYARRLQVQERLTSQVAGAIVEHLSPDAMVVVKARHMCMEVRGIRQPGLVTVTSAVRGKFLSLHEVRQEFLELTR